MPASFTKRCWCGALIITVTASGLVLYHDEPHLHQDSPSRPPAPTRTLFVSSTATTSVTTPIFGDFFRIVSS
jgi:hypothetical protein